MSDIQPTVEYRELPGFPGYRVGSDGSVWTARGRVGMGPGKGSRSVITDTWRRMKLRVNRTGRIVVMIRKGDQKKPLSLSVHRLVLLAFVGPCPAGMECCHNNGNPTDNRVCNLRWDTRASNYADRDRHGTTARGESHGSSKLTADIVRQARAEYAAGGVTLKQLATRYGVDTRAIHRAIRGNTWAHI